jgi:hypothetical protein
VIVCFDHPPWFATIVILFFAITLSISSDHQLNWTSPRPSLSRLCLSLLITASATSTTRKIIDNTAMVTPMDSTGPDQGTPASSSNLHMFQNPQRTTTVTSSSSNSTIYSIRHPVTISGLICPTCGRQDSLNTSLHFSNQKNITNSPKCSYCKATFFTINSTRGRRTNSYPSAASGNRSNSDPTQARSSQPTGVTASLSQNSPGITLTVTRSGRLRARAGKFISGTKKLFRALRHQQQQQHQHPDPSSSPIAEPITYQAPMQTQLPPVLSRIVEDIRSEPDEVLMDPRGLTASPTGFTVEGGSMTRTGSPSPSPSTCRGRERESGEGRRCSCSGSCRCSRCSRDDSTRQTRPHCTDGTTSQGSLVESVVPPSRSHATVLLSHTGGQFGLNWPGPRSEDGHRASFASQASTATPDQASGTTDERHQPLSPNIYVTAEPAVLQNPGFVNSNDDYSASRSSHSQERPRE